MGYFNNNIDNTEIRSKLQAHNIDGITVGRDDKSSSIIFYNTMTSSYYCPPDLRLDKSRRRITKFPNYLHFHEGLTCGLVRDKTDPINYPFPPGTHASIQHEYSLV